MEREINEGTTGYWMSDIQSVELGGDLMICESDERFKPAECCTLPSFQYFCSQGDVPGWDLARTDTGHHLGRDEPEESGYEIVPGNRL